MFRLLRYLLLLLLAACVAIAIYLAMHRPDTQITTAPAQIDNIRSMVRLCSVDIYSEVPVLDTLGDKVMFAVQKQNGTVSFDIEALEIDNSGDTVRVALPPEIVELYESTDDNAWQVIDTKNIGPLTRYLPGSDKFTDREENALKAGIGHRSRRRLYHDGTIARARAEAVRNLQSLIEKLYRKPVQVSDSTPRGARYDDYS